MEDTAILITTFLRDDALSGCVKSIRKHYLDIAVFIANTGHASNKINELCSFHRCTLVKVPFDSGVCYARNEAMALIPKEYKYIVILEDDIVFNKKTKLETWRAILQGHKDIGIIGCEVQKINGAEKKIQDYEASIRIENDAVYVDKIKTPKWQESEGSRYFYCDIISNVFMMRQDIWQIIKWDEQYKTTPEHTDFFLLLKRNTDWKVAFTDSVSIDHRVCGSPEYTMKRRRTDGYRTLAEKWGIKYYWNSWNEKWGMTNPVGLYTYAKAGRRKNIKETIPRTKREGVKIAIGIKTFMREESLFKTLDSIEKYFPYAYRLYIADDSGNAISDEKEYRYQQLEIRGHVVIRLPFNSGLSFGRNAIIQRAKEEYVLIMDDDIVLTDSESIEKMKQVLDSADDIGLCAGIIYQENGECFGGHAYSQGIRLEIDGGALFRHGSRGKLAKANGILFNYADQVVNFFLAKREVFKSVIWDNRIKIEFEHMDFFLQLKKTNWKATVCLGTRATHSHQLKLDPIYIRHRQSAPVQYFYAKHGIGNIINKYQQ